MSCEKIKSETGYLILVLIACIYLWLLMFTFDCWFSVFFFFVLVSTASVYFWL